MSQSPPGFRVWMEAAHRPLDEEVEAMAWTRTLARRGLVGAWLAIGLSGSVPAQAGGVDGAGQALIVPLVFAGSERQSLVTLTNAGPEPILVSATFVGAEGTLLAASAVGPIFCGEQALRGDQSATFRLDQWCPLSRDGQHLGYLKLASRGDVRINFSATTTTLTRQGAAFVVPGQPVGAFDPGRAPIPFGRGAASLHVVGLTGEFRVPPDPPLTEELACYVASIDEPKNVELSLLDAAGTVIASGLQVKLAADRMERLVALPAFGIQPRTRLIDLRVLFTPASVFDTGLMVAGCGIENRDDGTVAYQPARTPEPSDDSRLTATYAETLVTPGPYRVGVVWTNPALGDPVSRKVTLATYLRPHDRVRCTLAPPSRGFDPSPWLELQVRDPGGAVVAGGNRAADTGVFDTGPAGRYKPASGERWHIDVSLDEDALVQSGWPPFQPHGGWAVSCQSAAGMSALLPVDDPSAKDDF